MKAFVRMNIENQEKLAMFKQNQEQLEHSQWSSRKDMRFFRGKN